MTPREPAETGSPGRRQLGRDLRTLRHARSLRLEDVAAVLGVTPSTLWRIETGKTPTRTSYLTAMLDIYGIDDPAQRARLSRLARDGRRAATASGEVTLKEARQAAMRHLAETANTHPGTTASVLLRRLRECRGVMVDLLAASASPGQRRVPVSLLRFAATWSIRRELDAWVAEQRSGNTIRVLVHREPAELAGKITALEAARTT